MFLVFLTGVLGFLGGVPVFWGLFRVFRGCSRFFGCSVMFRCSGVPGSSICPGKCLVSRTLHYVSISLLFTSHFNAFSLFEQPSLKIKFPIINISFNFIVSLSFVQKI